MEQLPQILKLAEPKIQNHEDHFTVGSREERGSHGRCRGCMEATSPGQGRWNAFSSASVRTHELVHVKHKLSKKNTRNISKTVDFFILRKFFKHTIICNLCL